MVIVNYRTCSMCSYFLVYKSPHHRNGKFNSASSQLPLVQHKGPETIYIYKWNSLVHVWSMERISDEYGKLPE